VKAKDRKFGREKGGKAREGGIAKRRNVIRKEEQEKRKEGPVVGECRSGWEGV